MRLLLPILVLFCSHLGLYSQFVVGEEARTYREDWHGGILVGEGPDKPVDPKEGQWYYDRRQAGRVFVFVDSAWKHVEVSYGSFPAGEGELVRIKNSDMYAFATKRGEVLMDRCMRMSHVGRVYVGNNSNDGFALRDDGDTLAYFGHAWGDECLQPQMVDGKEYFCLPAYHSKAIGFSGHERCNWGLIDGSGTWVVEPVYDEYFKFSDGVAEVKYYGSSLKINVKGEVIGQ